MEEEVLVGGVANAGAVVRVGDLVLRPSNPFTPTIHRFLRELRAAGFAGASLPVGTASDGREELEFIPGDVPVTPFPDWAQTDEVLASISTLMRRFHLASAGIQVEGEWNTEMADPGPLGADRVIVCHNDVCLENVVFRQGEAVALLDFDFAAPGRPLYDLAQFARMCVPVDDPTSAADLGWHETDKPARLRVVADAYGLSERERLEFHAVLGATIDRGGEFVLRRVEAGDRNFIQMWDQIGGMERFDRRRRWWDERAVDFAAALR